MTNPFELEVPANGLVHRVIEWPAATTTPVVLLHGYMDAAGTWDLVAPALHAAGHRTFCPHQRGFGRAPRVPSGGYYHFADYVADLAELVDALAPDQRIHLVGHSMGGAVASYYAGAFPERIATLSLLEGIGPPDSDASDAPNRMANFIRDVRLARHRAPSSAPIPRERALARLEANHPGLDRELLATRLEHLVEERDGGVVFLFDPLHRTTSPTPFSAANYRAFAARVKAPVLAVFGGATGFRPPDTAERLAAFTTLHELDLPGAGHMMHWTRPDELSRALLEHFARA